MGQWLAKSAKRWVTGSLVGAGVVAACSSNGGGVGKGAVPQYPGAGTTGGGALLSGAGPDTANTCTGDISSLSGASSVVTFNTMCFYNATTTTMPAATVEQLTELIDGKTIAHLRITFDPSFVDNTYGANAIGWNQRAKAAPMPPAGAAPPPAGPNGQAPKPPGMSGHTFQDLVGSDHVELLVTDGSGALALDFDVDYISVDPSSPCGYGTLGVRGGEGKMLKGDASAVLAVATSLDRNLNGCGYCSYTTDSPATDSSYTPNPAAPRWDFRVVYEVWIDVAALGPAGFGQATLENVHASPSKASKDTESVKHGDCPRTWPQCTPNLVSEGLNCGKPGTDVQADASTGCPTGTVEYIISEGKTCVPVPMSGLDGGLVCPSGYHVDPISEGRFCLPDVSP